MESRCWPGPRRPTSRGSIPTLVYRAGLVHDLGRVAVPTGVWERPGPLRPEEWELVRLHPYHSGRIVARSPVLEPLGAIVSRHHERIDGSGYPAGVRGGELDAAARLLAAADVWHTLGEARPHRAALPPDEASRVISGMPLDRDAVRAVLRAADAPRASFPPLPVDLTERELEVLRLLAERAHQAADRRPSCSSRTRPCTPTRCTSTPSATSRPGPVWRCSPCDTASRRTATESPAPAQISIEQSMPSATGSS